MPQRDSDGCAPPTPLYLSVFLSFSLSFSRSLPFLLILSLSLSLSPRFQAGVVTSSGALMLPDAALWQLSSATNVPGLPARWLFSFPLPDATPCFHDHGDYGGLGGLGGYVSGWGSANIGSL
jgi:hypothetical protein